MIVLIPAYKPDEKFLKFLDELNSNTDFKIISVDDGGGPKYDEIFKFFIPYLVKFQGISV